MSGRTLFVADSPAAFAPSRDLPPAMFRWPGDTTPTVRRPFGNAGRDLPAPSPRKPRILFLYWGRRGLSEFVVNLADAAGERADIQSVFSVSRQNDCFATFQKLGSRLEAVDLFKSALGAVSNVWRAHQVREQIVRRIRRDRIDTVISLMPHVWGPIVAPAIRATGARLISVVHDAAPHPGDLVSWVASWLFRDLQNSDAVITLSEHVTETLKAQRLVDPAIVHTLFHPELNFAPIPRPPAPRAGEPLRLLFLGRILPYKGLDLMIDAVERLRRDGRAVEIGVFGEGALGREQKRLEALGAEIANRWLSTAEITGVLGRYHAVALSHTEASQSGVAAVAAGHGVPVIANPVGGLTEQVEHERTGLITAAPTSAAFAQSIVRLMDEPALYDTITRSLAGLRHDRSMPAFLDQLLEAISVDRPSVAGRTLATAA